MFIPSAVTENSAARCNMPISAAVSTATVETTPKTAPPPLSLSQKQKKPNKLRIRRTHASCTERLAPSTPPHFSLALRLCCLIRLIFPHLLHPPHHRRNRNRRLRRSRRSRTENHHTQRRHTCRRRCRFIPPPAAATAIMPVLPATFALAPYTSSAPAASKHDTCR